MTTVQVLEDEPDIARLLEVMSTHWEGVSFRIARKDFTRFCNPEPWADVDVAVIDYNLGEDMDGLDVMKALAEHHPSIRRIMFTAEVFDQEMFTPWAHHILNKPASEGDLVHLIRRGRVDDDCE